MRIWINKKEVTSKLKKTLAMILYFPFANIIMIPVKIAFFVVFVACGLPAVIFAILLGFTLMFTIRFKEPKKKGCKNCGDKNSTLKDHASKDAGIDNIKVKKIEDVVKDVKRMVEKHDRRKDEQGIDSKER